MLRPHAARRRSPNGPQLCAVAAAALLLLSLFVLHSRLSSFPFPLSLPFRSTNTASDHSSPLFDDADNDSFDAAAAADDRIDELDLLDDDSRSSSTSISSDPESDDPRNPRSGSSGLFWDHLLAVARRSFGRSADPDNGGDEDDDEVDSSLDEIGIIGSRDRSEIAFGSDDQPVDEEVRAKVESVRRIEDALMVKAGSGGDSLMREGWSQWLEGKSDFLRRDRMLRSNLEFLNPKNHPLLQDPDVSGLTSYSRGDRMIQKSILKEFEKSPFGRGVGDVIKSERVERRRNLHLEKEEEKRKGSSDGRRWGYFPGLASNLPFSEFMDRFFRIGQCSIRVFMVWNSPSWMYGVRHQRGLESLLHHHKDACVVMFSETMELDFFSDFVNDGFKIAVAMPDLDELLKDTPTDVFSSVWYEWRKTKHYPIHYSELVRLAALYKYGGVYLDSDVVVLKPLQSLKNSIGIEDQTPEGPIFTGAIMAFDRHSPFIMECLREFYSTYDDTHLRWNGAGLMTRVMNRLHGKGDKSYGHPSIKIEAPFTFFPISSTNITRYFAAAPDETGKAQEEILFTKILNESTGFHFWNGLTSALVPETDSLVERLLNKYCIRCHDLL